MILEVLKYVLLVVGIIVVGALIVYALANLMLAIVDPHGKENKNTNTQTSPERQIVYEQAKLIEQAPVTEEKVEQKDVQDVDLNKAREEELALSQGNFATLNEEEDAFIKEKQRNIEERLAAKNAQEEAVDEIDLDDIFVESTEDIADEVSVEESSDEEDEDIDALINRILAESDEEEDEEQPVVEEETVEEEPQTVETVEQVEEEQEAPVEEQPVVETNEADERVKALEEELARQKEEYEAKLQDALNNAKDEEQEQQAQARIAELEQALAQKEALLAESENKPTGATLSLEEYEARLETLKERLKVNDKELRAVKKEYLPLAKIKKSWEKDKVKLRRKEALVAKQKVVLYGVNNYVDIDEEKAKKLAEDLDLLDGLRLSVQHCEEVMKANEERFPILENSYNILLSTNENIKADIEECSARIAELKANQE